MALEKDHAIFHILIIYCSLVWGFTCTSNIEALFSNKQKKGCVQSFPVSLIQRQRDFGPHKTVFFSLQKSHNSWDYNLEYTYIYSLSSSLSLLTALINSWNHSYKKPSTRFKARNMRKLASEFSYKIILYILNQFSTMVL